ncbi:MAG TPA: glycosyltransferase [Moheibacter sp.]|nr:glycosyltransferase [Moheibacter sp.]
MKKALVVDWLDKYGGAEKVIQALEYSICFDEVYTLVNIMSQSELEKIFPGKQQINTTFLQKSGKFFRILYPLFFKTIKCVRVSNDVNLIISSSHSIAKGVRKSNPNQIHISYFQAPNSNYIWQDAPMYFKGLYPFVKWLIKILKKWDYNDGQNPDYIISNSEYVRDWVKRNYNRNSHVIYPPVDLDSFPLRNEKEDFYVIAGRIATIKRFDLVIKAFNKNKKKLIVIGDGEELAKLKKEANSPNIKFLGFQKVMVLSDYLQRAKALIQMGVEGFGIAAIEAQSCGTPIICYRKGGVIETVIDTQTGLFFDIQSSEALNNSIEQFEKMSWNSRTIHNHAQKFSVAKFESEIKKFIEDKSNY